MDQIANPHRVAPLVRRSIDGGSTWTAGGVPDTAGPLDDIACVPGGGCVATGRVADNSTAGTAAVTADGGASWTVSSFGLSVRNIGSLTCQPGGVCYALASDATVDVNQAPLVVLRSVDSGATWQRASQFDATNGSLRCRTADDCMLLAYPRAPGAARLVLRSLDRGSTWVPGSIDAWDIVKPPNVSGGAIACSGTRCFATGGSGDTWISTTADGGTTWRQDRIIPVGTITSAACPTADRCVGITTRSTAGGPGIVAIQLDVVPVRPMVGVAPARLLETRTGPGMTTVDGREQGRGALLGGTTYTLPVRGRAGVPDDAVSAILNVAVTETSGPGFLTVYPCDQPRPNASTLNYAADTTIANATIAKLSVVGTTCLYSSATVHAIVDLNGHAPDSPDAPVAITPARLLDTRPELSNGTTDGLHQHVGLRPVTSTYRLGVNNRAGVPANAAAAVLNVTVTQAGAPGFVTVYPCDEPRPNASTVNYAAGSTVANTTIAALSGGAVCLYTSATTHLIVDVGGYLLGAPLGPSATTPARLLETRSGGGLSTVDGQHQGVGAMASDTTYVLPVGGRAGVPGEATSAILNVAVTETSGPGFLTVYPCDRPRPNASTLNYAEGTTIANTTIAKLSPDGTTCLYTSATTHVIVDLNGYAR